MTHEYSSKQPEDPHELIANERDIEDLLDVMDTKILLEELPTDYNSHQLEPPEGFSLLSFKRSSRTERASIIRRRKRPDIGDEAFDSEVFIISQLTMLFTTETYRSPRVILTMNSIGEIFPEAPKYRKVTQKTCQQLTQQIATAPVLKS